jgi:hypothetical protein
MPFIPTPGGIKVCMRFTKAGQIVCNVFHVQTDNPPDVAMLELIASIFKTAWVTHLQGLTSSDVTLTAIEVTDISTSSGLGIEYTDGLPLAATNNSGATPNNVTVATKLTSGLTGRSRRGRSFMIGVPVGMLSGDKQHVVQQLIDGLNAFIEDVAATLITESLKLAILSLFTGGAPRSNGVLTEVLGSSVNDTLDSQRRRLPERGQ